jgi:hypothetical protein
MNSPASGSTMNARRIADAMMSPARIKG